MTDDIDIPDFLRISAADRRAAWERNPPSTSARSGSGRVITETERLYRASIERDKARKRAEDEARFREMRERDAADKAEREAVAKAVKNSSRTAGR